MLLDFKACKAALPLNSIWLTHGLKPPLLQWCAESASPFVNAESMSREWVVSTVAHAYPFAGKAQTYHSANHSPDHELCIIFVLV